MIHRGTSNQSCWLAELKNPGLGGRGELGVRREDKCTVWGGFGRHQRQRKYEFDMNVTDTVTLCLHTSTFPLQTLQQSSTNTLSTHFLLLKTQTNCLHHPLQYIIHLYTENCQNC